MTIIGGLAHRSVALTDDASAVKKEPERPAHGDVLWRYMDFSKFTSLLHKKALVFPVRTGSAINSRAHFHSPARTA